MREPVTLLIAHNQPFFRQILQNIFQSQAGFTVIGEVTTAAGLLETAPVLQPDFIIADIALRGMGGFATLQKLVSRCREVKVIISWGYPDEQTITAAMSADFAGYIAHNASPGEYLIAIKQAMKGEVFYCRQTEKLMDAQNVAPGSSPQLLNEKYCLLIYCIWMGYSSKETAIATDLKESTVNTYKKRVKNLVGSGSLAALESFMKKKGIK